jgi:hypothetical protein
VAEAEGLGMFSAEWDEGRGVVIFFVNGGVWWMDRILAWRQGEGGGELGAMGVFWGFLSDGAVASGSSAILLGR